ncbi:hypothetical protein [Pseudoxanthomonas spadix]|uniref:hypothetical protein n=1 Tax=Pseudoxanthomonas spadix TaxID=415229 RepID=UPI001B334D6A|nr:hypothetical protein [Pseudoxanthomonas spadix]
MEVKATATVAPADGRGLRRLAEQCGDAFKGGVVLHAGGSTIKRDVDHCLAVPLARLCGMYEVASCPNGTYISAKPCISSFLRKQESSDFGLSRATRGTGSSLSRG